MQGRGGRDDRRASVMRLQTFVSVYRRSWSLGVSTPTSTQCGVARGARAQPHETPARTVKSHGHDTSIRVGTPAAQWAPGALLEEPGENLTEAARRAGVDRVTLFRTPRRDGIKRDE